MNILVHDFHTKSPIILNWNNVAYCMVDGIHPAASRIGIASGGVKGCFNFLISESFDEIADWVTRFGGVIYGWPESKEEA